MFRGETASFEVLSGSKDIKVLDDKGQELKVNIRTQGEGVKQVSVYCRMSGCIQYVSGTMEKKQKVFFQYIMTGNGLWNRHVGML